MMHRVLFVDDEKVMCESVAAGLGTRKFDVTWRTSANDAFQACRATISTSWSPTSTCVRSPASTCASAW